VEPRRHDRQKLDPHRDAEPELEAIAGESCTEKNFHGPNAIAFFVAYLLSVRAISTGQLQRLLAFHPRPINVVVSHDPSLFRD
jgi:hypothetical protein